ncbi:DUF4192 family protein [Streptomyces beijiangensis]|uniref:DUF4192 family protein n=1 Tax=Streptomyces beijiangensis TaxID=163361 RepID=UPI001F5D7927
MPRPRVHTRPRPTAHRNPTRPSQPHQEFVMTTTIERTREKTLRQIRRILASHRDPSAFNDDELHRIATGLADAEARDRAFALIYPTELAKARALWDHVARRCTSTGYTPYTPPVHTLRAWTHWIAGDHRTARKAVHEALAFDPDYRLALLLSRAFDRPDAQKTVTDVVRRVLEVRDQHPEGRG